VSKLTTKARNKLPKSAFAGPDRSFPVENASHAANAKARATQAVNAGRMSKGTEEKIDAKANKVLGKSEPQKHTQVKSDRGDFAFKENRPNRKK